MSIHESCIVLARKYEQHEEGWVKSCSVIVLEETTAAEGPQKATKLSQVFAPQKSFHRDSEDGRSESSDMPGF